MDKIAKELDKTTPTNAETLLEDVDKGLVSTEFASDLRGYPQGEVEKAKKEHAERIARIQAAQQEAQIDKSKAGQADKPMDKINKETDPANKKVIRGKGKNAGNSR